MGTFQHDNIRNLSALIVDDQSSARWALRRLLGDIGGVSIAAEAGSVREAIEKLDTMLIDVVFLDINMPDATGLALARAIQTLQAPPSIVFASSHGEYALEAFDVNAVDFLVKPVSPERLAVAVDRVREHISLHALYKKVERIPLESGGKKVFIPIGDIRFAQAQDDYSYVETKLNRYFAVSSLKSLEASLSKYGFLRVHRSFLVNLDQIDAVTPGTGGSLTLTLNGIGKQIPVSRRRAHQLKWALNV